MLQTTNSDKNISLDLNKFQKQHIQNIVNKQQTNTPHQYFDIRHLTYNHSENELQLYTQRLKKNLTQKSLKWAYSSTQLRETRKNSAPLSIFNQIDVSLRVLNQKLMDKKLKTHNYNNNDNNNNENNFYKLNSQLNSRKQSLMCSQVSTQDHSLFRLKRTQNTLNLLQTSSTFDSLANENINLSKVNKQHTQKLLQKIVKQLKSGSNTTKQSKQGSVSQLDEKIDSFKQNLRRFAVHSSQNELNYQKKKQNFTLEYLKNHKNQQLIMKKVQEQCQKNNFKKKREYKIQQLYLSEFNRLEFYQHYYC